ncbi:hypothetical protein SmJEL517_g04769 [Synchytrium microbalum]|uniref:Uncharacterized protein n=1 Tax=Synchytrium microbalum TaxID=1806994 RepID=A0A507C3C9_9FUNG|nr:uncharacterized protein SmJEL517_g04769 [Synchytrium microbalum]TPX32055.1 hypothetical protein SmJEL517_g04769 [Synchytrium microbalum]
MFGCIVAGRMVQTNLQQVQPTKYLFELTDAQNINHVVVFLTEGLPAGFACTVFLHWPGASTTSWRLLGMISNDKPSAIFKLGGKEWFQSQVQSTNDLMVDEVPISITAQLGISIEPIESVFSQISTLPQLPHTSSLMSMMGSSDANMMQSESTALVPARDPVRMVSLIIENLYNYLTSFAVNTSQIPSATFGSTEATYIPAKALQEWYFKTNGKLKMDPSGGFLKQG